MGEKKEEIQGVMDLESGLIQGRAFNILNASAFVHSGAGIGGNRISRATFSTE